MLLVKIIVLLLLGFVMVSLFFGLYYLVKDKGQTNRTVNALSFRIGLSLLAILVVVIAGAAGVIDINPSHIPRHDTAGEQTRDTKSVYEEHEPGSGRRLIQP